MSKKLIRYRFNVPEEDEMVVKWCQSQYDLSASLRQLVKGAVNDLGYQDVTCAPLNESTRPEVPKFVLPEAESKQIKSTVRRDDDNFVDPMDVL